MMKKQKLSLAKLRVSSFVTSLDAQLANTAKGGTEGGTGDPLDTTTDPTTPAQGCPGPDTLTTNPTQALNCNTVGTIGQETGNCRPPQTNELICQISGTNTTTNNL